MIKYTCSLGTCCHSSNLLKMNNLKKESYPFDWIFSDHKMIINILENNFIEFLNKENYVDINRNKKCGHKLYHEKLFWHHNPRINEDDYNYFIRCVERFKNLMKSDDMKLFIYLVKDTHIINEIDFIENVETLNSKLNTFIKNYIVLAIYINPNKMNNDHKFIKSNNIDYLYIDVLSCSDGIKFTNDIDNDYINNIIKSNYEFNL